MRRLSFCQTVLTSAVLLFGPVPTAVSAYGQETAIAAPIDILPSLNNPKLRFGTGKVDHNRPQISPILPDIPGNPSGWIVTQWNQSDLLSGDSMKMLHTDVAGSTSKTPSYDFTSADGHSYVRIYQNDPNRHPVYELYERNGTLKNGGGSNLFLTAAPNSSWPTFDKTLNFSVLARLSEAQVNYTTPSAETSGAVLGMAFIGFVIEFPNPVNGAKSTLFLQLPIANSRNRGPFLVSCRDNNGTLRILAGGALSGVPPLVFEASEGAFKQINYNVTDYVKKILSTPRKCVSKNGHQSIIPLQNVNLSKAALGNFYIGLETQNKDERPNSKDTGSQGNVSIGLQLSNLHLRED